MGDDDAAAIRSGLRQSGRGTQQGDGNGCCWVSGESHWETTTSGGSAASLFSSTSSLTDDDQGDDDDATSSCSSSPPGGCRRPVVSSSSPTSSSDQIMHMDGAAAVEAAGPLYELSTMLDHLPSLRTGLSEYYRGRSQSFTSLADVGCVEDLAKKTAPYIVGRRTKASRCFAAALGAKKQLSKKIILPNKVQKSSPKNTGHLRKTTCMGKEIR